MTKEEKTKYEKILRNARRSDAIWEDKSSEEYKKVAKIIQECKEKLGYTKGYASKGGDAYANLMFT